MTDFRPGKDEVEYLRHAIAAAVDRAILLGWNGIIIEPDNTLPGFGFRLIPMFNAGYSIDADDLERNIFEALVGAGYARPDLLEA